MRGEVRSRSTAVTPRAMRSSRITDEAAEIRDKEMKRRARKAKGESESESEPESDERAAGDLFDDDAS
ncbi:Hypothetical protein I5071_52670 [Sandaracinus amylolyticus]|nr:Hypothetical protein I5071_52670 [Sandaracinus amylolyticus]